MKKLLCVFLAAVLLLGCASFALAADDEAAKAADTLHSLGLFRGRAEDENGNPIYDLGSTSTRAEALVMLIRLLGKEEEALACTASHPFTDVKPWADRYVAYAYEMGLTNGMSETEFGMDINATAQMYLTFVLRSLGYSDSGEDADFSYQEAVRFAGEKGLPAEAGGEFLRGDMAVISLAALGRPINGEETTLIASLVDSGAVDGEKAAAAGFVLGDPAAQKPAEAAETVRHPPRPYGTEIDWGGSGEEVYIDIIENTDSEHSIPPTIPLKAVKAYFPDAVSIASATGWYTNNTSERAETAGISEELGALEVAVFSTLGYRAPGNGMCYDLDYLDPYFYPGSYTFIFDKNLHILGFYDPNEQADDSVAVFQRKTADASVILNVIEAFILEERSHCFDNELTVEMTLSDNPYMTVYSCEGFLNGRSLKETDHPYYTRGWTHLSDTMYHALCGLTTDADRDSYLGGFIFASYYLPSFYKVNDEWRLAERSLSFGGLAGCNYIYFLIDSVTDDIVGCIAYCPPEA